MSEESKFSMFYASRHSYPSLSHRHDSLQEDSADCCPLLALSKTKVAPLSKNIKSKRTNQIMMCLCCTTSKFLLYFFVRVLECLPAGLQYSSRTPT